MTTDVTVECSRVQFVDGEPVCCECDVRVQVWQVRAGRATLYLLDPDVPENTPADRALSAACSQEDTALLERRRALLDGGAARTLAALGIDPAGSIDPGPGVPPGVHVPGWIARDVAVLVERYLGAGWRDHQDDARWWDAMSAIPEPDAVNVSV